MSVGPHRILSGRWAAGTRSSARGRLSRVLAVLAAALLMPVLAWADVQGLDRGSHGRLVFSFDAPANVVVSVSGQEAELSFDRPIGGGLEAAAAGLPAYLRGAARSSDGRSVGLALAGPMTVQSFSVDRSVIVDLRPANAAPATAPARPAQAATSPPPPPPPAALQSLAVSGPAAPQAAAPTAPAAPADAPADALSAVTPGGTGPVVVVRGGQHSGYSRVVFDWNRTVDYQVSRSGDEVTVRFEAPARASFTAVPVESLRNLAAIEQRSTTPLTVALTVPPGATVQDLRVGPRVVIDIRDPPPGTPTPPAATPAAAVPTPPTPPPAPAAASPVQVPRPVPTGPPASVAPPGSAPPPAPPPSPPAATGAAPAAPPPAAPTSATPAAPATAAQPSPPAVADSLELRAEPPPAATAPSAAAPPTAVAATDLAADEASRRAVIDPGIDSLLAAFRRGGDLWLVLAAAEPLDVAALAAQGGAAFGVSEVVPAEGGVALRFVVPGRGVQVERNGTAWQVTATDNPRPPLRDLAVEAQPDFALGSRLLIRTPDARGLVRFTDPEVGDVLVVAPLRVGSGGMLDLRRLPQVDLLPTALGAVVRTRADDVAVRLVDEGVEIAGTGPGGLLMSPSADVAAARAASATDPADAAAASGRFLHPIGWMGGPPENFYARRFELEQRLATASDADLNRARLDLARFHFAQHLAPEALGLLRRVAEAQPDIVSRPEFALLQGASMVLAGQSEEGLEVLRRPAFRDSPEAAVWRGVALAQLGEWADAARNFEAGGPWLRDYVSPLLDTLVQAAAQTALERGNVNEAERLLARLSDETAGASDRTPAVAYYRGKIALLQGDIGEAERRLNQAAASNDRYYRTLAELDLIELWRDEGRLTAEQAVGRLQGLQYAWRGDWLEFDIHQRVGDTLWEAGQFDAALQSWEETAARFPDRPDAQELTDQIPDRVSSLFAADRVNGLSPLAEYALFQEYREMLPGGEAYIEIVERLAERMAEIELLDRAGDLLEGLVRDRLEGSRKERAGTRLAALRLLDGEPRLAITALDMSESGVEDPAAALERRLLRARALSELGRTEEAFALLAADRGQLVNAARLDIARRAQDWPRAARALANLVGDPPANGQTLPESRAQLVLNLAVALALSNDRPGLSDLASRFGPSMEGSPHANLFALLTRSSGDMGPIADLSTIRRQVREVDMFQEFLSGYLAATGPALTN